jgi:hypothetical protein
MRSPNDAQMAPGMTPREFPCEFQKNFHTFVFLLFCTLQAPAVLTSTPRDYQASLPHASLEFLALRGSILLVTSTTPRLLTGRRFRRRQLCNVRPNSLSIWAHSCVVAVRKHIELPLQFHIRRDTKIANGGYVAFAHAVF